MSQYFSHSPAPASGEAPAPVVRGKQNQGQALASLILGLLSFPLMMCAGWILAPLALILGIIGLVKIRKRPDRYKGGWMAWVGMAAAAVSIASGLVTVPAVLDQVEESAEVKSPKPRALLMAEKNISVKKSDRVAFGNSEPARSIAENFSRQMKELREVGFSSGKSGGISLSGGEFLTHCELREDTCAIIVHVPDMRKFDSEAKAALNDLAWHVAQNLLAETDFPEGGELAVGLKGVLLYDDIRLGRHVKEWPEEEENPGKSRRGLGESALVRFFSEPKIEIEKPAAASPTVNESQSLSPTTPAP